MLQGTVVFDMNNNTFGQTLFLLEIYRFNLKLTIWGVDFCERADDFYERVDDFCESEDLKGEVFSECKDEPDQFICISTDVCTCLINEYAGRGSRRHFLVRTFLILTRQILSPQGF